MDRSELLKKLIDNIEDNTSAHVDSNLLSITIFYKEVAEIKQRKMNYFDNFVEVELSRYHQGKEKHKDAIQDLREEYEYQMTKLEQMYAKLYMEVTKFLDNALDNQNNSVSNIVANEEKLSFSSLSDEDKKRAKIIERAEYKKVQNYNVIIRECRARQKWCVEEAEKALNDFFPEVQKNENLANVQDTGILDRIMNIFTGGYKFTNALNKFQAETLKTVKDKVDENRENAAAVLIGVTKQVKDCKKQIKEIYERQISAAN